MMFIILLKNTIKNNIGFITKTKSKSTLYSIGLLIMIYAKEENNFSKCIIVNTKY